MDYKKFISVIYEYIKDSKLKRFYYINYDNIIYKFDNGRLSILLCLCSGRIIGRILRIELSYIGCGNFIFNWPYDEIVFLKTINKFKNKSDDNIIMEMMNLLIRNKTRHIFKTIYELR